jgi:hypothetical protein
MRFPWECGQVRKNSDDNGIEAIYNSPFEKNVKRGGEYGKDENRAIS